ncbi:DUF2911 domain-containing protein [Fulvivirga sp. RKSG066]|uniref:DUF2911 domain-containing protein n=1 Tax=Fulvivirga aurantia TaxID=2529383 RepID=UPI0012BC0F00|nr:DUF2911 domain-containing protein [Fulvivirga aurantia]MTI21890.1 DUF2911 domain-containing protein [Fulvivirga aurantia]
MKLRQSTYSIALTILCLFIGTTVFAQGVTLPRASAQATVKQTVGISEITVNYSRPNVISPQGQDRSGDIWGNVVPYGYNNLGFGTATEAPWRAGANENTTISLSHDAQIGGKELSAGTYGLHIAVMEDGNATVIFNKKTSAWGSYFYDKADDALRVEVETVEIPQTNLLTYNFIAVSNNEATLALDWEKKRIPVTIAFDTPEIVYQNLQAELESSPGFNLTSWTAAANYLVSNNVHLEEALTYANNAVEGQFYSQKNFQTLQTKASVLSAMGKTDEAQSVMEEALKDPSATINNYYNYGRLLIGQDQDAEALEIFKKANKRWPDHWLAPHGLARGYSANGDITKALKYEKTAYEKAPENSKQFLAAYLQTLEEGKDFN